MLERLPKGRLDLICLQTFGGHTQPDRELPHLVLPERFALLIAKRALCIVMPIRAQPEHTTGISRTELDAVFAREQRLSITAKTAHLSCSLTLHAGNDADAIRGKLSMKIPQLGGASSETPCLNGAHTVVRGKGAYATPEQPSLERRQTMLHSARDPCRMRPISAQ